jgi:hypothetical protein
MAPQRGMALLPGHRRMPGSRAGPTRGAAPAQMTHLSSACPESLERAGHSRFRGRQEVGPLKTLNPDT